ncbi:phage holin family protein, partial [Nocardia cyriacigeorgica]|nr:phage holin family protein [Nocardia cyriacigeorgica]
LKQTRTVLPSGLGAHGKHELTADKIAMDKPSR